MILGIDEVGRGCLAGPVYLGGVLLGENWPLNTFIFSTKKDDYQNVPEFVFVRDSKKLSEIKRNHVVQLIETNNLWTVVLSASNELIDDFGIGACLSHMLVLIVFLAQRESLEIKTIVDGKIKFLTTLNLTLMNKILLENITLQIDIRQVSEFFDQRWGEIRPNVIRENKADDKYLSVALASNFSKVKRDELMNKLSTDYPEYGWNANKGYGTIFHRNAIQKNPDNSYLRLSFLSRVLNIDRDV